MKHTFKNQITLGDMVLFVLLWALIAISLSSCETQQDVESDLGRLKQERTMLEAKVNSLHNQATNLSVSVSTLKEKEHQLARETSGKPVHYILRTQ
jgi:peptidoglycan hydrolase CwlO-like protein